MGEQRMAWQGAHRRFALQAVGRTHTTGYQENREVNNRSIMLFMTSGIGQTPE